MPFLLLEIYCNTFSLYKKKYNTFPTQLPSPFCSSLKQVSGKAVYIYNLHSLRLTSSRISPPPHYYMYICWSHRWSLHCVCSTISKVSFLSTTALHIECSFLLETFSLWGSLQYHDFLGLLASCSRSFKALLLLRFSLQESTNYLGNWEFYQL